MLIILDRDGVINFDSDNYIKSPEEWIPIPGSLEAIAMLNQKKHTVVIATNQSGMGRGYYLRSMLEAIHQKMQQELLKKHGHIDGIYFCPHTPEDHCACRKPRPGLLLQIKKDYPDLFPQAVLIGDALRDLQAARAAGCKAILVKTGKGSEVDLSLVDAEVPVYADLFDYVQQME
ncbi:MAG: D-glycero-beta-D-manno-heptose-1,7-bisphosphate 7-phosphatase [Coxiella sp. RIFCSPHIGHO2_12_FULL_42_15]|nr:MAG: D-glycero-beta-D-manno-heptose-1,7-bisphosphate 7-phosphatase [Coxiella sp. RIFCSPHIGHO2_12_FULL_42_15]